MRITDIQVWNRNLALTRPYAIAYQQFNSVHNTFICLRTDDGHYGVGSAAPVEAITHETQADCLSALQGPTQSLLINQDINDIQQLTQQVQLALTTTPAACAAADMALYDLWAKIQQKPLVELLGQHHHRLPTSITIGILSIEDTLTTASEYINRGFKIIKQKLGSSIDADIALIHKLREHVGSHIKIRVDPNQAYSLRELKQFIKATAACHIELIEQPMQPALDAQLLTLDENARAHCMADESLFNLSDAKKLTTSPHPYGAFNIKLMKCGGISCALNIAEQALQAQIPLMWGCMDESIISITAALHAAFACPATRYLDLDGSLDLAEDVVSGGFELNDGYMHINNQPGLGVTLLEGVID